MQNAAGQYAVEFDGGVSLDGGILRVDVVNEFTAAAGVTVESVVCEGGRATCPDGVVASGTSFPTSPVDGLAFVRTDLSQPNRFVYDAARSKWLGEFEWIDFGLNSTPTTGDSLRSSFGSVVPNNTRGFRHTYDVTVVGLVGTTGGAMTGDMSVFKGTTWAGSSIGFSNADESGNMDLDVDWTAATDAALGVQINFTSGTPTNPAARLYMRRLAT